MPADARGVEAARTDLVRSRQSPASRHDADAARHLGPVAGDVHGLTTQKENTMNMVKRCVGVISVLATVFAPAGPALAQHGTHSLAQTPTPAKVNETGAAVRDLWVGHVFGVRTVFVSTFAENQRAVAAAEHEVVANAKQIAAAIEPYYGKDASEKLFGVVPGDHGDGEQ